MEDKQKEELRVAIRSIQIALTAIRMLQEVYSLPDNATVRELKDALIEMYRVMTDDI